MRAATVVPGVMVVLPEQEVEGFRELAVRVGLVESAALEAQAATGLPAPILRWRD